MKITIVLLFSFLSLLSCGKKDNEKILDKVADTTLQTGAQPTRPLEQIKMALELDSAQVTDIVYVKTTMGNFVIGLYGKDAPKTVNNFLGLVRRGYYNGVLIHRIARNFLIQFGDRNTLFKSKKNEWGKGGQSFFGKPFEDELNPAAPSYKNGYLTGIVAMANRGPNTNTSQLFICLDDAIELEKKWTIFGRVVEGLNVVRNINAVEVVPGPFENNDGIPLQPVKIIAITIKK